MARSVLTAVSATTAGVAYTMATPDNSNGNHFLYNDGNHFLLVSNASGGSLTVTIQSNDSGTGGLVLGDLVVTVANSSTKAIRIPPPAVVTQSDGYTQIDWSTSTSVTAALIKLA